MRKLSKTLAVMGLLAPVGASALGVGEIQLHSALNQQLNAEIPLIVSPGESVADIRVKLASPEAFEKAGIVRHFFLSNIKFEPVVRKDGSVVIKLTSREAVREPFLNFLLEVDWPQGNMYREFTVLVDPPATYKEAFIPDQSQPVAARPRAARGATVPTEFDVSRPRRTDESASRYAPGKGVYGPIAKNDTLWVIAKRVNKDPSVSHEQMMLALFEHNPGAFYKQNINALMAGKTLRVPDREVIVRLSARDAAAEFQRQNAVWSGKLDAKPRSEPAPMQQAGTEAEGESQLKLLSPTEAAATKGETAATGSPPASGSQADLAMEMAETVSQENEDLRSRVEELERHIKSLESMLTVKDAQLSALQGGAEPSQAEPTPKILDVDAGAERTEAVPDSAAPASPASEPPTPAPVQEPAPQDRGQTDAAAPEEGDTDSSASTYLMTLGGVGAVLLGLLGWWLYRRKMEDEYEAESILSALSGYSDEPTNPPQPVVSASDTGAITAPTTEESSFLSEFTPSDFDAFETDQLEVDPISEADVYLAYGRYKQAEELMRSSLNAQPDRDDCKLKLLEIYYASEDAEAFEKFAGELRAANKDQDEEFWEKVVEMGRDLCPSSALFKAGSAQQHSDRDESASDEPDSLASYSVEESESMELGEQGGADRKANGPRRDDDASLDFDLSSFESESPSPESKRSDDSLGRDDMEFDFSGEFGDVEPRRDFDFDLSVDEQSGEGESSQDLGEGAFSDLTDMDEIETKLDLARAYVDMNDDESARSILDEVIEAGNEDQKKEATELMKKLSL